MGEVTLPFQVLIYFHQDIFRQKSPQQLVMTFGYIVRTGEQTADNLAFIPWAQLEAGKSTETEVRAFEGADHRCADRDHAAAARSPSPDGFHRGPGNLEFFGERKRLIDAHIAG